MPLTYPRNPIILLIKMPYVLGIPPRCVLNTDVYTYTVTAAHCRRLLCSAYTTTLYVYHTAVFTTQLLTAVGFSNISVFKAVTWKELDFNELVAQGLIDISRVPIETNSRMFKPHQGPPALNRRQNFKKKSQMQEFFKF